MKRLIFIITAAGLFASAILPLYSQDTTGTEPEPDAPYVDQLFSEYIELETDLLFKYDGGGLNSYNLGEIENLRKKAADEGREDITGRLDMLAFVVREGLAAQRAAADPEGILSGIEAAEMEYRKDIAAGKVIADATAFSIGTAIVSGTVFALSSISSADFYDKYVASESADQAGFYLFWWQFLEKVSFFSALTTLASGISAGILAAVE